MLSRIPLHALGHLGFAVAGDLVSISNKATSGNKSKFGSSVKSLVIGAVPDRGGRASQADGATAKAGGWKDMKRKGRH